MDFLIDAISNFFIQHPFAQVIGGYVGKLVGILLVLLLVTACLYLALSKKHVYQFPKGSVGGLCWKAGWLLDIVAVVDLSYRMYTGTKHISVAELIFDCIPTLLMLFAMLYSVKHDQAFHLEQRQNRAARLKAKQERT